MKKINVTCSVGFLLLAAGLIYLDGAGFVLLSLLACALHEIGHGFIAFLFGSRVRALRVTAVGAEMELEAHVPLAYWKDALVALAGPGVNLITAVLAARANFYLFAGLNLCFGILNLLPVYPLDGGKILASFLSCRWPFAAGKVVYAFSVVFSGALLGLGWAAWRGWGNLSLLCTAAWIMAGVVKRKF